MLAAVGLVIMGQVDNVVRPLLLAGKAQMNTLVLIISLLGGVSAFGFIGIVLGPLVAALVTAIVESYHEVMEEAERAPDPPRRRRSPRWQRARQANRDLTRIGALASSRRRT